MPSYKTLFKVCVFKKTFSRQEKHLTEKRFPAKRGSEGIKAGVPCVWNERYGQGNPGPQKEESWVLKLEPTETWESWVPGLWPDTARMMFLIKWLYLCAVMATCTIFRGSVLWDVGVNYIWMLPSQYQGDCLPSLPKSSAGGICSMLAGSPLRETFSFPPPLEFADRMVCFLRLIVCTCLCVWKKLSKRPDGQLDAKCSPSHAWQGCVAHGLCSSTELYSQKSML